MTVDRIDRLANVYTFILDRMEERGREQERASARDTQQDKTETEAPDRFETSVRVK
jgi:hypothetical protein